MKKPTYCIDIAPLIEKIKKEKLGRIALQTPDSISERSIRVARVIKELTGANVFIVSGINHGPCHYEPPGYLKNMGIQLFAIGTWSRGQGLSAPISFNTCIEKSPGWHLAVQGSPGDIPLMEVSQLPLEVLSLEEILPVLERHAKASAGGANWSKKIQRKYNAMDRTSKTGIYLGIVTVNLYLHLIERITRELEANGFNIKKPRGGKRLSHPCQVYGCNYSGDTPDIGHYLFIGSKLFHPRGLALATGKPVAWLDPYTGKSGELDADFPDRKVEERYNLINRCRQARKYGILISGISGQQRFKLAARIKDWIAEANAETELLILDEINPRQLNDLPFDAYVNTACPRIALDDFKKCSKPILTPWELRAAIGKETWNGTYRFDEFSSPLPLPLHWKPEL